MEMQHFSEVHLPQSWTVGLDFVETIGCRDKTLQRLRLTHKISFSTIVLHQNIKNTDWAYAEFLDISSNAAAVLSEDLTLFKPRFWIYWQSLNRFINLKYDMDTSNDVCLCILFVLTCWQEETLQLGSAVPPAISLYNCWEPHVGSHQAILWEMNINLQPTHWLHLLSSHWSKCINLIQKLRKEPCGSKINMMKMAATPNGNNPVAFMCHSGLCLWQKLVEVSPEHVNLKPERMKSKAGLKVPSGYISGSKFRMRRTIWIIFFWRGFSMKLVSRSQD